MALDNTKTRSSLKSEATHDWLTKLPNRFSFNQRIRKALISAEKNGAKLGIILMDLDNFKDINDTYGHSEGDLVLQKTVAGLRKLVAKSEYLVRWGGDEFLWVLPRVKSERQITDRFSSILDSIHAIGMDHPQAAGLTASIGYAMYPDHGRVIADLIEGADYVMYQIKEWRNQNALTPCAESEKTGTPRSLDPPYAFFRQLCSSLGNGRMIIAHQPIWNIKTRQPEAIECLPYWHDDQLGVTIPASYIRRAKHAQVMPNVGRSLMEGSLLAYKEWRKLNPSLRVAFDLTHFQLLVPRFLETILELCARHKIDHKNVMIEVTGHSGFLRNEVVRAKLCAMQSHRFHLVLKNFGFAYSNLDLLSSVNFQSLKIGGGFLKSIARRQTRGVIEEIQRLGERLGMDVIAEDVSTAAIVRTLARANIHLCQGSYYSGLLKPDEITHLFRDLSKPAL